MNILEKYKRIPYFSNPYLYDQSNPPRPMGKVNESDCARVIDEYASIAAAFSPFYTASGTMIANEWWNGAVNIIGNVTVPSGVTLTIRPGTQINVNSGASIIVNGILSAVGSSSSRIVFNFGSPNSGTQNGIKLNNASSGVIQYVTIQNAYYGIYSNGSSVTISDNIIQNNSTGIRLYSSLSNVCNNTILNNTNYGIQADNISPYPSPRQYHHNYIQGNGMGIFLNNVAQACLYNNVVKENSHGIYITSGSPQFFNPAYSNFGGYNIITCSVTPLFRAENSSHPYLGYDGDGGYNSIFGSELPDMEAYSYSGIYADNNYWAGYPPAIWADRTSWILARNPLSSDPNPGASCEYYKIAAKKSNFQNIADDYDLSMQYFQEISLGNKRNFPEAQKLLKSIIKGNYDKKYSPLALMTYYDFSNKEAIANKLNDFFTNSELNNILNELRERPLDDSLRSFAIRLSARNAALSGDYTAMNTFNTELINNYPKSVNELTALYDLMTYHMEVDGNLTRAKRYFEKLEAGYPQEYLTKFAKINFERISDIYNNPKIDTERTTAEGEGLYLGNAYPNPFNPSTTISYRLKEKNRITFIVYDMLGKEVERLAEGIQDEGVHTVNFNGINMPSGVYVYQLKGPNFIFTKKCSC